MTDWFHHLASVEWGDQSRSAAPNVSESPGPTRCEADDFHPPRPSDAPTDRNVTTLANGDRLDTPERFFDFLECHYRDHPDPDRPDAADQLVALRRRLEPRAQQRRRSSYN